MLVVGIAIGAALTAGWHGLATTPRAHAVATHGADNFAIATGLVDDQIEALYFLDYLTGDLRAAIIVNRRNGQFTGYFRYNVLQDFEAVGDPARFLMVTGMADLPVRLGPDANRQRPLIYVAEASSGQVAAYVLPFNSTNASGAMQSGSFVRVARGSFRDAFVRDE